MVTYGNISQVMVFKSESTFAKALKLLTDEGNGFETSGYPLALNFYEDGTYSFPYAETSLAFAGIKNGEDYEVKYR